MKLERYFTIVCILVITCCFTVGCEKMQTPMMDAMEMVTETETPMEPEMPMEPETPTETETPMETETPETPEMPETPETPEEPEVPEDPYANLPEIAMSAELEPGKYRISNVGGTRGNFEVISITKLVNRADRIVVTITLNPRVLDRDAGRDEELVVEILRKIEVIEKMAASGPYTSHEYEGRIIKNLSRPEIVFEYEEDTGDDQD